MKNTKTESSKVVFEPADFAELETIAKSEERPIAAQIRFFTLKGLEAYRAEKNAKQSA